VLAVLTLAAVASLLLRDAAPAWFPAGAHATLGALPLVLVAVAYLAYTFQTAAGVWTVAQAAVLVLAFLFWAANQLWPLIPQAGLFNAIGLNGGPAQP
jgi:hypothetical protein